jgi:hypothetical protein
VSPGRLVREIEALLEDPARDELSLVLALQEVTVVEAPLVALSLRAAGWTSSLSAPALPFVLRFFQSFGSYEDAKALEELCRHPDPRVLGAAIEALERIHPESLKDLIVPLLINPVPGIRSRAVRLLYRWDPQEALRHFEALLFSEDPAERAAALTHAVFFPYPSIGEILLRFLGREEDPELLRQAGALVAANPTLEAAPRLADLRRARSGAARELLDGILQAVAQSLVVAGLIRETPSAYLARLVGDAPLPADGAGVAKPNLATAPSLAGAARSGSGESPMVKAGEASRAGSSAAAHAEAKAASAELPAAPRPVPAPASPPYALAAIQEMRRRQARRPAPGAAAGDTPGRAWFLRGGVAVLLAGVIWLAWMGWPGRGPGGRESSPVVDRSETTPSSVSARGPEVWLEGTILLLDPSGQGILVRADRPEPGKVFVQGFGAKGLAGLVKGGRFAGRVRIVGKERLTTIADLVP